MKAFLALLALCLLPLPAQLSAAAPARPAASAAKGQIKPAALEETQCEALRKRYRESADCYAPFLNANGTRKPGALEACGEPVSYPARECSSEPLR